MKQRLLIGSGLGFLLAGLLLLGLRHWNTPGREEQALRQSSGTQWLMAQDLRLPDQERLKLTDDSLSKQGQFEQMARRRHALQSLIMSGLVFTLPVSALILIVGLLWPPKKAAVLS